MSQRLSVCSASLINFTCRGQTIMSLLLRLKTSAPPRPPAPPLSPLKDHFSLPFLETLGHSDSTGLRHIVRRCIRPFHVGDAGPANIQTSGVAPLWQSTFLTVSCMQSLPSTAPRCGSSGQEPRAGSSTLGREFHPGGCDLRPPRLPGDDPLLF